MRCAELEIGHTRTILEAHFVHRTQFGSRPLTTFLRRGAHFLYYQQEGVRHLRDGGERLRLGPGDVLLFFADRPYPCERPERPYRAMNLLFEAAPGDRFPAGDGPPGAAAERLRLPVYLHAGAAPRVRQLFEETVQLAHARSPLRRAKASINLLQLLVELALHASGGESPGGGRMDYAAHYIERHARDRVSLAELARSAGMSRRSLTRRFREATGRSILQYRLDVRIRLALSILHTQPETTNRELADTLGFYDEFHFSRTFRKRLGRPPSAFRKGARLNPGRLKNHARDQGTGGVLFRPGDSG
jgi:AraC-like DNA-binding protein